MGKSTSRKKTTPSINDFDNLITTLPVNLLLRIGKAIASSDYAVRHFNHKHHPMFYKKRSQLEKAIKRAYAFNAFDHRERIVDILRKEKIEFMCKPFPRN